MKRWLIGSALLVACGTPHVRPVAPSTDLPAASTCPVGGDDVVPSDPVRAQLVRELAAVDHELDAIDAELAASEMAAGMGREQALGLVADRIAELSKLAIEDVGQEAPLRLYEVASDYAQARDKQAELRTRLGPKHPEMIAMESTLAWYRAEFERRRGAELAELTAWHDELGKLARGASPARVRQARLRAMRSTLALAPSDAPAEVWLAAQDIAHASRELESMTDLGPKHPDRVRTEAELAAGKRALDAALTAATTEIDAELSRLDSTTTAPFKIDAAKISRRAELAAHARELRRAYELRYER